MNKTLKTKVDVDLNDLTVTHRYGSRASDFKLYFLTNKFANGYFLGYFLGFWSGSPWGRCQDQDRGWAVLDPKGNVVSDCQTFYFGSCSGGFRNWLKDQKSTYGKTTCLKDDFGTRKWKMND